MTYMPTAGQLIAVQAAWNPDKSSPGSPNGDGIADMVAGKSTAILFNPTNVQGITADSHIFLSFSASTGGILPTSVDHIVTTAEIAAQMINFYPPNANNQNGGVVLDNDAATSSRNVAIKVTSGSLTGTTLASTTVTVRKTNDLSIYFSYYSKSNIANVDPTMYQDTVVNGQNFIKSVYPVKTITTNTPDSANTKQKTGGASSTAGDCVAAANLALKYKYGYGIAVASDDYFLKNFPNSAGTDSDYAGISYGPDCKGAIVRQGYWTSPAHELGHILNLYNVPTKEEYINDPLWGQMASGVSPSDSKWRSGQDFMGAAPKNTLDNTWVNSAGTDISKAYSTYNLLFNALTKTTGDPEIAIVSGIFHKSTGQLEIPTTWSLLEGTPSDIVSGEYQLRYIGADGNPIPSTETDFDVQYGYSAAVAVEVGKNRPASEGGIMQTDEAPFCFAVALPEGTAAIEVWGPSTTDPTSPLEQKGEVTTESMVDLRTISTAAYFTDADYNPITTFECIFTPDKSSYKMTATNPGTLCYNLKITNIDQTGPFTAVINLQDFVLKSLIPGVSAVSIDGVSKSATLSGTVLTVQNIQIDNGQTETISVSLDYGLKAKYSASQPYTSTSQTTFAKGYAITATINTFPVDTAIVAAVGKKSNGNRRILDRYNWRP